MPSAGTLPWLQGILCNANNPCFRSPTPGESPGVVGNFNDSIFLQLPSASFSFLQLPSASSSFLQLPSASSSFLQLPSASSSFLQLPSASSSFLQLPSASFSFLQLPPASSSFLQLPPASFSFLQLPSASSSFLQLPSASSSFLQLPSVSFSFLQLPPASFSFLQISRLFSDAKKILLYSQDDRNLDGFKKLAMALKALQKSQSGFKLQHFLRDEERLSDFLLRNASLSPHDVQQIRDADVDLEQVRRSDPSRGVGEEERCEGHLTRPLLPSAQVLLRGFGVHLRDLCPSRGGRRSVADFVTIADRRVALLVQEVLCREPAVWLDRAEEHFLNNLDFLKPIQSNLKSDPEAVKLVSRATNDLLDSLGSLAVELAGMKSWVDLRTELVFLTQNATASPSTMYQAVNRTFQELGVFRDLGGMWVEMRPKVWNFMENSEQMDVIRTLLKNNATATLLQAQLIHTGWTADHVSNFLSKQEAPPPGGLTWKEVFNETDQAIMSISRFMEDRRFWAGIVFPDVDPDATELPETLSYKIRMDIDNVERTNKIKDAYWDPGPRADPFEDMRYIWGGFSYLQDVIEQGIIRAMTGAKEKTGVYIQQMPYPCYVDDM
ncbi:ATP-binding cassette sub-family A member 1 [Liparis tanakae]|uniref:ATP-binding cassette sub-family A member 1 n=1 Tax=Liparis tanakae TaxID=230148 RepID=A0A4Z2EVY2_9TELE|nr:ATP-binding cassette sub-family A member 1 [Liparis tanakae]